MSILEAQHEAAAVAMKRSTSSRFLQRERMTMEKYLPGLDAKLEKLPLRVMEAPGSGALQLFREHGGPGLLISKEYGGMGANALEVTRIHRALGSRSPSLAIATNMHTCTVAAIPPCAATAELLQSIAQQNLYLASGFADGRAGSSVLVPNLKAEPIPGGWRLSGSKKPCSLSESMDFLTASVLLPSPSGQGQELALATIPTSIPGIEVKPFRDTWVLAGSETNEVVLKDVEVSNEYISYFGNAEELNTAISKAFLWFELFVSACYLGAASNLVERVFTEKRGSASERMSLCIDTEGSMAALEGTAHELMAGCEDPDAVARFLYVRYTVQRAIERVTAHAAELLGGMAYLGSNDVASLFAACRALAFHPPSRLSVAGALDEYMMGRPLVMP
jgi:alkylation response protein AidB-like acyl-CoA dehydrogenase